MDTYSYGWVVDYANLRCGEKRFAVYAILCLPANLNSLANRIQRKTVILYWGHHAQLTKQSRSEFSQAPKNAAMRSCRGIAIVCPTLTAIYLGHQGGMTIKQVTIQ